MNTMFLSIVSVALVSQLNTWTPLVASEGAMVTLEEPTPNVVTDCPATGPLDPFRDAIALIRKGNALADQGQAILDAAQRQGKITLDIQLPVIKATPASEPVPAPKVKPGWTCDGSGCRFTSPKPVTPPLPAPTVETDCSSGSCRPRFWRFRR